MAKNQKPSLQYSIICDDVANFHDSAKLLIVGVFEQILVDDVPTHHSKLWVLTRWTNGVGDFTSQTKIVNPKGDIVFESEQVPFSLKTTIASYNINGQIFGLPLELLGNYWVETYLDGELVSKVPLVVVKKGSEPVPEATTYH